MPDSKSTLLFIPDISGFTNFVNTTEINHSRHIISELLEIIISSDKYGMSVSEIEGDAVLFFKEEVPGLQELIEQCMHTFLNFHAHLDRYDVERICRCGACETASKLSLKFIIHSGQIAKIKIKDYEKLHGSDVILAHRLLKNSINYDEYILITDNFELTEVQLFKDRYDWIDAHQGVESYEDFDDINYLFIPLNTLYREQPNTNSIKFPGLSPEKIQYEKTMQASVDKVYENFTNFEKRMEWNEEVKDVIIHGDSLNKSGALHTCLIGPYSLDIESLGRVETIDQIIYGERLNEFRGLKDIINIYTFIKKGDQTHVKVEVDYKIKSFWAKLMKPVIRKMLQKQTEKGLMKLKKASEEHAG